MKKFILIICLFFAYTTTINAAGCVASEGCQNCGAGESSCKSSQAYKDWLAKQQGTSNSSCSASTGCQNCGAGESSCKASETYKKWQSCTNQCANVPGSDHTKCFNGCMTGNPNTPPGGSSGGGTGTGGTGTGTGGSGNNGTSTPGKTPGSIQKKVKVEEPKEKKDGSVCSTYFGGKTGEMIHDIYNVIKIVIPLFFLGMSVRDFGMAVIKEDGDGLKKAIKNFKGRIIIVVAFFVLPTLLSLVFDLLELDNMKECIQQIF